MCWGGVCVADTVDSYVTERGGPVDLVVGADAGVLCLESEWEGGDVED